MDYNKPFPDYTFIKKMKRFLLSKKNIKKVSYSPYTVIEYISKRFLL